MTPCTEEKPLGDEALKQKQAKAEEYLSQPERFTLFSLELEVRGEHGNHLVIYIDEGGWSCNCDFFKQHQTCSHTMATGRIFKALPVTQPYGNRGFFEED